MDELTLISISGIIATFGTIGLVFYLLIKYMSRVRNLAHLERMAAIERGVAIPAPLAANQCNPYLWPLVFIGIGLAGLVGNWVQGEFDATWGFIPLFIGAAMLAARVYYSRKHPQPPVPGECASSFVAVADETKSSPLGPIDKGKHSAADEPADSDPDRDKN